MGGLGSRHRGPTASLGFRDESAGICCSEKLVYLLFGRGLQDMQRGTPPRGRVSVCALCRTRECCRRLRLSVSCLLSAARLFGPENASLAFPAWSVSQDAACRKCTNMSRPLGAAEWCQRSGGLEVLSSDPPIFLLCSRHGMWMHGRGTEPRTERRGFVSGGEAERLQRDYVAPPSIRSCRQPRIAASPYRAVRMWS